MIIEIRNLKKQYHRGREPFLAVNNVSLSLDCGDFVCITGRSGSGKSTLLSIAAGLLPSDSGSVIFDEKEYKQMTDDELALLRNEHIGYINQGQSVLPNFTVLQNVLLPYYLEKEKGSPSERACMLLEKMGIGPLAGQYPSELSGGELRRVSIARSLMNNPKLLIADEPTGDLDPGNTEHIMKLFRGIAEEGTAILLVTHDLEALEYGNRYYSMDRGSLTELAVPA